MANKNYATGLYFNHKRQGAPEFVIGSISVKKDAFIQWLNSVKTNDKGYINIDVLDGKEKPYCVLNEYVRKETPSNDVVPF